MQLAQASDSSLNDLVLRFECGESLPCVRMMKARLDWSAHATNIMKGTVSKITSYGYFRIVDGTGLLCRREVYRAAAQLAIRDASIQLTV